MPFNGGEVIEAARGLDPSFSPQNHPDRICLEFLTRYQRRLSGKMLSVEAESISSEITIDLPLDAFAAGAILVDADSKPLQWDRIHGFELTDSNGEKHTLPVVPFKDRITAMRTLYGWMRQNVLFLTGNAGSWNAYTGIICTYAPTAGVVTLAANLIFPDNAFDACVLALGAETGKRKPHLLERKTIAAEAKEAEEDFLNLIEDRNDVEIGVVRRVFSL